jgi:hypothetical protein
VRFVAALAGLILWGCTSVYVQTGNGTIDASTDVERSVKGKSSTVEQPRKEKEQP